MENEKLDGPWKVVGCGVETLEEVLNEFVAGGYLVHSIHPKEEGYTVCGIDQSFVQGVNILTEEQAKELKGKLNEETSEPVS